MADLINTAIEYIQALNFEGIIKISIICITIVFVWPISQSYNKIYDITLINRMPESCTSATLRAQPGTRHVKGSDDHEISSNMTHHYQVVPSWRGLYGSDALYIKLETNDKKSVIIPVYNSGDTQRSRVFFIEATGVRESGTTEGDGWTWSVKHVFGQQGN